MRDVPRTHPRYESLRLRDAIVAGVEQGVTSTHGLVAHGRGEAFDYLLTETTHDFARTAITAAARMLQAATAPVLSVNGNTAALVAGDLVQLAHLLACPLEVNIFHKSHERERAIENALKESGAKDVLLPSEEVWLDGIDSNRRYVNPEGIFIADVVFVPLEDGDRCEMLRRAGKEVITVDLNPLSRTARRASISIIDNVVRAVPLLSEEIKRMRSGCGDSAKTALHYDNDGILAAAEARMRRS